MQPVGMNNVCCRALHLMHNQEYETLRIAAPVNAISGSFAAKKPPNRKLLNIHRLRRLHRLRKGTR